MLKFITIKSPFTTLVAIFSVIIYTEPVKAAILVSGDSFYTNSSSFIANTNGLQTLDFEGLSLPNSPTSFQALTPNPINGVTFTGASLAYVGGGGNRFPSRFILSGDYLATTNNLSSNDKSISAILPGGITAVGASLSTLQADFPPTFFTNFTISLADGSSQIVNGNAAFVGFTSSSSIDSITFSIPGGGSSAFSSVLALDNFKFGYANAATPVPEPFTIIGTLIGGTAAFRMRKKLKAASK